MAGYTPVFDSIYTGTLYGKWPTAAVWASLLPLFDKNGVLDLSIDAICGMTGWPRDLMEQGINALMQPDPHSRTKGEDGRRLVLIDPDRSWGWRAVNHSRYREKARLLNRDAERVASGQNAARMARRRTPGDPRRPPETPADPPSDADAYTDADKNSEVRSGSSLHLHVSGSSLTLKPQERLKKSSEEGRSKLQALTRSLAQSKRLPK